MISKTSTRPISKLTVVVPNFEIVDLLCSILLITPSCLDMPVLQRSCQACAKARRRCSLTSPCCARCSTKRITCSYINKPAPAIIAVSGAKRSPPSQKALIPCRKQDAPNHLCLVTQQGLRTSLQMHIRQVLRQGHYQGPRPPLMSSDPMRLPDLTIVSQSIHSGLRVYNPRHLEVIRMFDQLSLDRMSNILQSFPAEFSQHGATSFIHPGLYESNLPLPLQQIHSICGSHQISGHGKLDTLRLTIQHLLGSAKQAKSLAETVSYAQAINLAQIIRLLQYRDVSEDVEHDNQEMWTLTHQLWQSAPISLPCTLSPWQAWLYSETIRRTIMICNILLGVYSSLRRGYAVHSLCVEALPFDMRTELWFAESEESWTSAALNAPGPSLVTCRQFTAQPELASAEFKFEALLMLAFK